MVYLLAEKLSASRFASLIAALLFAVHPLHVESVAWVSARKDVLSGLFFFSSLYFILQGKRGIAFIIFLASMMAKPSTVVLPVVAILVLGWRDGEKSWGFQFWRRHLMQWRWWLLSAMVVGVLTVWFQSKGSHSLYMDNLPLGYRLKHLPGGLLLMIWHTLWPVDLTFHYRYPDHLVWLPLLSWLVLLTISVAIWIYRSKAPAVFFVYVWFIICSLPSSGILYVGTSYTADRYSYLGLTAAFIVIASLHQPQWSTMMSHKIKTAVATLLILLLSVQTHHQCATWKDGWTLFTHGAKVQPANVVMLHNLGAMHQMAGQHPQAIDWFQQALQIAPRDGRAWFNLGNSLREMGQLEQALNALRRATEVAPHHANAWRNLGLVLGSNLNPQRDPAQARHAFSQAVSLTLRKDPVPLLMLANIELELRNFEKAQALLRELQALQPADEQVRRSMEQLQRMLSYAS